MRKPNLSKSRYTKGMQCPKMLWMDLHMPDQFDSSVMNDAILATGSLVGDVAMGYYGEFIEVSFDSNDFEGMVEQTSKLLESGCRTICEATFAFDGNLCMVDILRVEDDGVHIVEVKSSTHLKDIHYHDMAYQTWVLRENGLDVKSVSLMHLNNQYVRQGDLDLHELFTVEDCTDEVMGMLADVSANVSSMREVASQATEPDKPIGLQCKRPYECGYRAWCWKHIPKPSVFDLNRIQMRQALDLETHGVVSLSDAYENGAITSRRQLVQAECEAKGLNEIIDRESVSRFLNELSFPLYFLDFETFQPAIPIFDGTRPYQQIPTQYSLHILRRPNSKLEHREFLADAGSDPRKAVAEHLVEDIPKGACTLAYNMSFEKGRIKELAASFPDMRAHLMSIHDGMMDLLVPFQNGWYNNRAMGGSNSIKAVLPALFPGDPELDYHALDGVHNGFEAMDAFARLGEMEPEEARRTRLQLLRYCELDTYAMVKIWQRLVDVASDGLAGSSTHHPPTKAMIDKPQITFEYHSPEQVYWRGKQLEGMTFRDVLDLGVVADGVEREYNSRRYKGGMGNLLEERYFGYRANSDREPDFAEAGVELKATCIDRRKNGTDAAGERLVLTMIPYDEEAPESLYDSHLWHKCRRMLLVWYRRDKSIDPYDQRIEHVLLFTPPAEDLRVMEADYALITGLVRTGRADELSESLTTYLGACTKGATAAKSMREQTYYAPGRLARSRAFSLKQSYMNYVLHHYVMGAPEAEHVVADPRELERRTLVEYVTDRINAHIGESDRELCRMLDLEYTGNKAQWTTIAYRLLGIRGDRAAEFEKAGIRVRTLRPEPNGKSLKESAPITNIDFLRLASEQDWNDSELRGLLSDIRYLFVVFQKDGNRTVLRGCKVWGMPERDLDGPVRECWERTRDAVVRGVKLTRKVSTNGKVSYSNDFPKISDDIVAHVRPRAAQAAYRLEDGTEFGNIERDAEELPDGRWMTRQAFWLNSSYMLKQIADLILS